MVTKLSEIKTLFSHFNFCQEILDKISVWRGDITKLEIDVIVNAANSGLRGGGGVDGAIHQAAGWTELQKECRKHGSCDVGHVVSTSGCNLTHVKSIFHAVGPQVYGSEPSKEERVELFGCYARSLELAVKEGFSTIAFPCISTGIYGYPNQDAADDVIRYLYNFFKGSKNKDKIERVVLCLFLEVDVKCYYKAITDMIEHIKKGIDGGNEESEPAVDNTQQTATTEDGDETEGSNVAKIEEASPKNVSAATTEDGNLSEKNVADVKEVTCIDISSASSGSVNIKDSTEDAQEKSPEEVMVKKEME